MTSPGGDTIFALSSGQPPAAIAIVRISGPQAASALHALAGEVPEGRRATLRHLRDPADGEMIDRALILWFPGPATATGQDLAELHLHGGRSVVSAVLAALGGIDGLQEAEPGEFTRRAFQNGRIDLIEAEGLADLLTAETQAQRRAALALAGGALSRTVEEWRQQVLTLAAGVEARIDFSDEGDVGEEMAADWTDALATLIDGIGTLLSRPGVERLRDGIRVSIAGPPNVGKSSLLNRMAGRDAAITSPVAGTTRDLIEVPVAIEGKPFLLIDTAGIRDSDDLVESLGIARTEASLAAADIIVWLGDPDEVTDPTRTIIVTPKADLTGGEHNPLAHVAVSSVTGQGVHRLVRLIMAKARTMLPVEGEVAVNERHRRLLTECLEALNESVHADDLLLVADALRRARLTLDRITGRAGVEDMLDTLFGRFCIGK